MILIIIYLLLNVVLLNANKTSYDTTWASLDSRPLPSWYDEAKFGIYLHWGIFAVPSFDNDEFWQKWTNKDSKYMEYMYFNKPGRFSYPEYAAQFKAEFFQPQEWADIISNSGAKYVVLNAKSEEGFTLWPSPYSWNWNSLDIGPKRDIIGELTTSIRLKEGLRVGFHYSLMEWFNPFYIRDKQRSFSSRFYIERKLHPEIRDLVNTYNPDIFLSSGDEEANEDYWKSKEFLAWLYNESPVKDEIVVNDQWGLNTKCHHGGFVTCAEQYMTGVPQKRKFENLFQIDKISWGFRREAKLDDFYNVKQLIAALVRTISYGGNFLLNIGPTSDGKISPLHEERLRNIGEWLQTNGEAIYGTTPWTSINDTLNPHVWYTSRDQDILIVYAITLEWPQMDELTLGAIVPLNTTKITLLGLNKTLSWEAYDNKITIKLQNITNVLLHNQWAWTFKLEYPKMEREHRKN